MKAAIKILVVMIAAVIGAAENAQSQVSEPPLANYPAWNMPVNGRGDSLAVPYWDGRTDTLWRNNRKEALKVGQYKFVSLTAEVNDTARFAVTVKKRVRGETLAAEWSTILTDSLINYTGTVKTKKLQEFVLRNSITDLLVGLDIEIMVIVTHLTGNDTQGTARRRFRLNYTR